MTEETKSGSALPILFLVVMIDMIGFGIVIPFLTYFIEDLATLYISNIKPTDIRGRYEENRFLILLPDTDYYLAQEKVYERLKNGYLRSENLKQRKLKKSHNSIATIDKIMIDAIIQREQININSIDAVIKIRNKVFDILNEAHQNHKVIWNKTDANHYLNEKNAIAAHYLKK